MKRILAALLAAMMLVTAAFAATPDAPGVWGGVIRLGRVGLTGQKPMAGGYTSEPIITEQYGEDLTLEARVYEGEELFFWMNDFPKGEVVGRLSPDGADKKFFFFETDREQFPSITFRSNASLSFHNADETSFVYELKDGKLFPVGSYSPEEGCWVVKTKTLGQYIVSDTALTLKGSAASEKKLDPSKYGKVTVYLGCDGELISNLDTLGVDLKNDIIRFRSGKTAGEVERTAGGYTAGRESTFHQDYGDSLTLQATVQSGDKAYLYADNAPTDSRLAYLSPSDANKEFFFFHPDRDYTTLRRVWLQFNNADANSFVYKWEDGQLVPAGEYVEGEGHWVVNTQTLGQYIVSDKELTLEVPAGASAESPRESDRDGNRAAEEAAMAAVEAANNGKTGRVQSCTTAAGATVPAVPVKLYGLNAALSVDTMETLAAGKTGLNVNLDNGAAGVLIPAGFTMPTGTGVLGYSLGWQKDPLYTNLMMSAVKGDNAKTEVYKLGGGTLPTAATVTLKTKLTGKVNVYHWDEDTRKATLIASPAADSGKVTFAAKRLGNFILTTGTV